MNQRRMDLPGTPPTLCRCGSEIRELFELFDELGAAVGITAVVEGIDPIKISLLPSVSAQASAKERNTVLRAGT